MLIILGTDHFFVETAVALPQDFVVLKLFITTLGLSLNLLESGWNGLGLVNVGGARSHPVLRQVK